MQNSSNLSIFAFRDFRLHQRLTRSHLISLHLFQSHLTAPRFAPRTSSLRASRPAPQRSALRAARSAPSTLPPALPCLHHNASVFTPRTSLHRSHAPHLITPHFTLRAGQGYSHQPLHFCSYHFAPSPALLHLTSLPFIITPHPAPHLAPHPAPRPTARGGLVILQKTPLSRGAPQLHLPPSLRTSESLKSSRPRTMAYELRTLRTTGYAPQATARSGLVILQ